MRATFALVLAVTLGACGSDGSGGDDATTDPDANPTITHDLELVSPDISIDPGQEVTYCWYFRAKNTKPLAIKHWQSTMTLGSHHLILYTTKDEVMPPGMVSTDCGSMANGLAVWSYSAQTPEAELRLPSDDGTGKPLAMEIGANQPGFIQMHYNNRSDQVIKAHVVVTADALPDGAVYTRTAAYVTYNGEINIPAGAIGSVASMSCNVPSTSKFWVMTTHAHKQATHTAVKDGATIVFESSDWEHPGTKQWDTAFYTFASGKLTYECTYNNPRTYPIMDGDSAQYNEMCMASGYFFPATKPVFCYDSLAF
jgi:hypothetical protein